MAARALSLAIRQVAGEARQDGLDVPGLEADLGVGEADWRQARGQVSLVAAPVARLPRGRAVVAQASVSTTTPRSGQ